MRWLVVFGMMVLAGCATTGIKQKRSDVLACTKDLRDGDAPLTDAFEVCRQLYSLKKVRD